MSFDWQNVIAIGIVALAMAYLARHFYRRLTRRVTGGCGSCGTCPSGDQQSSTAVPLVSLGDLPPRRQAMQ